MSPLGLADFEGVEVLLRPDDCPECGGSGGWTFPVMHAGTHIRDLEEDCAACRGTGVRHCGHGVPRGGCPAGECAVEEVMSS